MPRFSHAGRNSPNRHNRVFLHLEALEDRELLTTALGGLGLTNDSGLTLVPADSSGLPVLEYEVSGQSQTGDTTIDFGVADDGALPYVASLRSGIRFSVWTQNTQLLPDDPAELLAKQSDLLLNEAILGLTLGLAGIPGVIENFDDPASLAVNVLNQWGVAGLTALVQQGLLDIDEISDANGLPIYHSFVENQTFDNIEKADLVSERSGEFQIVALQEVFDYDQVKQLREDAAEEGYFYFKGSGRQSFDTGFLLPDVHYGVDAGLGLMVSDSLSDQTRDEFRHRAVHFEDRGGGIDALSNKGFTLDRVQLGNNPDHYVHVVNTHLHSTEQATREAQLRQIADFVNTHTDPRHPVIFMGDFNITERLRPSTGGGSLDYPLNWEYEKMLKILGHPEDPFARDSTNGYFTLDKSRNAYAYFWSKEFAKGHDPASKPPQRPDHILIRQGTEYGIAVDGLALEDEKASTRLIGQAFRDAANEGVSLPDTLYPYLSDHYGLSARLRFIQRSHVVLDMNERADGNDGSADRIDVTVSHSRVAVSVNGKEVFAGDPEGFASLTIRGSTDDNHFTYTENGASFIAPIHFSGRGFESLAVDAGTGDHNIDVHSQELYDAVTITTKSGHTSDVRHANVESIKVIGGGGNDVIRLQGARPGVSVELDGGDGDDNIAVDPDYSANTTVRGGNGHDVIRGGAGNDSLDGGAGDDVISGGGGNDTITGGAGTNQLAGEDGFDTLRETGDTNFGMTANQLTGPGSSTFSGFERAELYGGPSGNRIDAGGAPFGVWINGSGGDDTLIGSAFDDVLKGEAGDDALSGDQGTDQLFGDDDWHRHSGQASDIGVGADGRVWKIGTDVQSGGHGIYLWSGSEWLVVPGGAERLTVDAAGRAWVVNDQGSIYRRKGTRWIGMPGKATDIGAGSDGSIWIIGADPQPGGYGIYRWGGANWEQVSGAAVRVAVDNEGNAWVVNDRGRIYRWTGSAFERMPGSATDIGVGADGSVWKIGTDPRDGGYAILRWTGNAWKQVMGAGTQIAVGPDGLPWVVNDRGNIYQMGFSASQDGNDILLGGDADDLVVGAGGRDLLGGGEEADRLNGGAGDDLLIAGFTAYEDPPGGAVLTGQDAAFLSLMEEWTSDRDYTTRLSNLGNPSRGYFLSRESSSATVLDDEAADVLNGGDGQDWFFANGTGDVLTSLEVGEVMDEMLP